MSFSECHFPFLKTKLQAGFDPWSQLSTGCKPGGPGGQPPAFLWIEFFQTQTLNAQEEEYISIKLSKMKPSEKHNKLPNEGKEISVICLKFLNSTLGVNQNPSSEENVAPKAACGVPVHQSPKCVLDCSQGPVGRDCHTLGSKCAFFHSQKEDPLRNLLVYSLGVKETIWICQYVESLNNILNSLYLVLDSCSLVLDVFSLDLDSCSLNLDSSATLRIQLLILGLLLRYCGLQLTL
ncbi:hypothetical protein DSO57_1028263 [Entomophthora muscae]|uniref:Uncharacterized protein n=1 Tax=Entomophthora muscae TaxID=34485 RepID=A0ACC2ULD4_9FUNG|nr:hypothetical protein DSO57_1028263 [Entomophthora muscae]